MAYICTKRWKIQKEMFIGVLKMVTEQDAFKYYKLKSRYTRLYTDLRSRALEKYIADEITRDEYNDSVSKLNKEHEKKR